MQKLVEGIHQFQLQHFGPCQELFERLEAGQRPEALFITCADSRISPSLLTQTRPGDLFILRNAGNLIPPHGAPPGGEAATVEFAVKVLGVRDIIVCGHSQCGAMQAVLNPGSLDGLPHVRAWLEYARPTRSIVEESYTHLEGRARLMATIEENVLVQMGHLRTHPFVAEAVAAGTLRLHAWVYKFETGEVFGYDPRLHQYVPLTDWIPPSGAGSEPDLGQRI